MQSNLVALWAHDDAALTSSCLRHLSYCQLHSQIHEGELVPEILLMHVVLYVIITLRLKETFAGSNDEKKVLNSKFHLTAHDRDAQALAVLLYRKN